MIKNSSSMVISMLKKGTHLLIGNQLSNHILPACQLKEIKDNAPVLRAAFEKESKKHPIEIQRYFVPVSKGCLDTLEINPKNKSDFYIVRLVGNGGCYEKNLTYDATLAVDLNINILSYNYRGVCESNGCIERFNDLIEDCKLEVKRLIKRGVPANKIILTGFSLGAAIAAVSAIELHALGAKVNVFCDRTFASLTDEIVGLIKQGGFSGDFHETMYRQWVGQLAQPIVDFTLSAAGWEANIAEAFAQIPDPYKEYLVVRTCKAARTEQRRDDSIIPYAASLHKGLKHEDKSPEEKYRITQRKFSTDFADTNGHLVGLCDLHNRYGQSGSEFFKSYVVSVKERVKAEEQQYKLEI